MIVCKNITTNINKYLADLILALSRYYRPVYVTFFMRILAFSIYLNKVRYFKKKYTIEKYINRYFIFQSFDIG